MNERLQENGQLRVMIADDHLIVREGLRLILEGQVDFELVGDAVDGASAVRLAEERQPHVVLMDIRMPGMDGLQTLEHIRRRWPWSFSPPTMTKT